MNHLRESEVVDFLDQVLPPSRARHVEECAACAEVVESLRTTCSRVADVEVPEPSPLFWEHFSARVRDGVKDATPADVSPWSGWLHHGGVRWALASALVAVIVVAGLWTNGRPIQTIATGPNSIVTPGVTATEPGALAENDAHDAIDTGAADDDRAWDLVQSLADDMHWDDQLAAGLEARPATVERAVLSLKGEARAELARLIEAETKRTGA